jgi:ABC-type bacteriocin/lantibiotic exporter with double-glycine peptidase domain
MALRTGNPMIKHLTQRTNTLANDCSQACAAMLVNAYQGLSLTIEQLARATGTNTGKFVPFTTYPKADGTRVIGLNDIFAHYNLPVRHTGDATIDWYRETLARGVPVLALVDYSAYTKKPTPYEYAHFLLVTGFSDTHVTVNDPLQFEGPTTIPMVEFIKSINQQSSYILRYDANGKPVKGYNYSNQAMYPLAPIAAPVPTFAGVISTVAREVRAAGDGLRDVA